MQRVIEDFAAAAKNESTAACNGHEARRSVTLIERNYNLSKRTQSLAFELSQFGPLRFMFIAL